MTIRNPNTKPGRRPGFTLVEILTVIVIIGILAGLTIGGGIAVRNTVRKSIVIQDMKQLEMALQNYRSEMGEFPPDFAFCELPVDNAVGNAARARVANHLRKAFPKMRVAGSNTIEQFVNFVDAVTDLTAPADLTDDDAVNTFFVDAGKRLSPSTALTFWLGGPLDGSGKPQGFHENPANPFQPGEPRTKPYFDFDTERLELPDPSVPATMRFQYLQPGIQPESPYVYFRAIRDAASGDLGYADSGTALRYEISSSNVCVPYLDGSVTGTVWRAPETYQIITAGLDGVFSSGTPADIRYSKSGEDFTDGDFDNLASFAEGELEDEL